MKLASHTTALALLALSACEGTTSQATKTSWQTVEPGFKAGPPSTELEALFPLVDGNLYHYRMESLGDQPVPGGMLMMKVHRKSPTEGELRKPGGNQSFTFGSDGIATTTKTGSPAFLVKLPFDLQNSWLGPHGGKTQFAELGISVNTPSGTYAGCHRTREEVRGDLPKVILTTLCKDVGIVSLRVEGGGGAEQAELVYYGPPIDIGPDGVTKEPSTAPR